MNCFCNWYYCNNSVHQDKRRQKFAYPKGTISGGVPLMVFDQHEGDCQLSLRDIPTNKKPLPLTVKRLHPPHFIRHLVLQFYRVSENHFYAWHSFTFLWFQSNFGALTSCQGCKKRTGGLRKLPNHPAACMWASNLRLRHEVSRWYDVRWMALTYCPENKSHVQWSIPAVYLGISWICLHTGSEFTTFMLFVFGAG